MRKQPCFVLNRFCTDICPCLNNSPLGLGPPLGGGSWQDGVSVSFKLKESSSGRGIPDTWTPPSFKIGLRGWFGQGRSLRRPWTCSLASQLLQQLVAAHPAAAAAAAVTIHRDIHIGGIMVQKNGSGKKILTIASSRAHGRHRHHIRHVCQMKWLAGLPGKAIPPKVREGAHNLMRGTGQKEAIHCNFLLLWKRQGKTNCNHESHSGTRSSGGIEKSTNTCSVSLPCVTKTLPT